MTECKHCFSTDLTYVTNYEHLTPDENWEFGSGWLCQDCECFDCDSGYYGYYASYEEPSKVNYL
jgi:hypothetical protein